MFHAVESISVPDIIYTVVLFFKIYNVKKYTRGPNYCFRSKYITLDCSEVVYTRCQYDKMARLGHPCQHPVHQSGHVAKGSSRLHMPEEHDLYQNGDGDDNFCLYHFAWGIIGLQTCQPG